MNRPVFAFILAAACLPMAGCGGCGGTSAADMRRYASRKSAPDNAPPAATPSGDKSAKDKAKPAAAENAPAAKVAAPTATNTATAPAVSDPAKETPLGPAVSNERPDHPLTEVERRARSIANLEKIGKALAAYVAKHKRLPAAGVPRDGELLLSWRVIILPELGYPELHARFRYDEPWDGKRNKLLLDYIPAEYQSPERFDAKTNYLGVAGRGMAFPTDSLEGLSSGTAAEAIKDGADNTLAVVEVDDKYAQEWTRPTDHVPLLDLPSDKLGGLRGEGAFGAMVSGRVVLLPRDLPPSRLAALFTAASREPIGAASFLHAPTAEPPPPTLATIADDPAAANIPLPADAGSAEGGPLPARPLLLTGSAPYAPDPRKEAVPDEPSLAKARELLKELYRKDFEKARTRQQQQEFVKKLLADVPNVEQNPADFHELLRIARDMATALGDLPKALAACELLEQRFQIDPLSTRLDVLQDLCKHARTIPAQDLQPAMKEARRVTRAAFDADRYDLALPAHEVVLTFARLAADKAGAPGAGSASGSPGAKPSHTFGKGTSTKIGTPDSPQEKALKAELARLDQDGESLAAAKSLFTAAERALTVLSANANDAAANEAVGKYLCFVKDRWDAGLPYLAKAADIRWRGIASLELAANRSQQETLSLAEQYWDLAGRFKQPQKRGLHLRAVYCYELAASSLASSLEKIKLQRRIDEAVTLYSQEEVNRVLAPIRSARTGKSSG